MAARSLAAIAITGLLLKASGEGEIVRAEDARLRPGAIALFVRKGAPMLLVLVPEPDEADTIHGETPSWIMIADTTSSISTLSSSVSPLLSLFLSRFLSLFSLRPAATERKRYCLCT